MYAEVDLQQDTTTLYVRWEIRFDRGEQRKCEALGGPVSLVVEASRYVDVGGTFHEKAEVEVPIHPHPGLRNRGQAKFKDFEARRRFVENLQAAVASEASNFVADARPGSVGVEGMVIRRSEFPSPSASPA